MVCGYVFEWYFFDAGSERFSKGQYLFRYEVMFIGRTYGEKLVGKAGQKSASDRRNEQKEDNDVPVPPLVRRMYEGKNRGGCQNDRYRRMCC